MSCVLFVFVVIVVVVVVDVTRYAGFCRCIFTSFRGWRKFCCYWIVDPERGDWRTFEQREHPGGGVLEEKLFWFSLYPCVTMFLTCVRIGWSSMAQLNVIESINLAQVSSPQNMPLTLLPSSGVILLGNSTLPVGVTLPSVSSGSSVALSIFGQAHSGGSGTGGDLCVRLQA